jgi:hypothetical protein
VSVPWNRRGVLDRQIVVRVGLVAFLVISMSIGCTEDNASAPSSTQSTIRPIFDELDLQLDFARSEVASGRVLPATLIVENRSGHEIVDPECLLSAWRYGLIPSDEPSAALWQQVVIDCGGNVVHMPDGYAARRGPVEFRARTSTGEPLPTGSYLAAFEIPGRSGPLTYPIKVI